MTSASPPSPRKRGEGRGEGRSWWHRRVVSPILAQLKQGITPHKIALTLALGGVLGIFPILGSTMLLCGLAGVWLRLNQPMIQLVNYLAYPLQVALLIPFYRAGENLFGAEPVPIVDVGGLMSRFAESPWQFIVDYGMVGVYGVVVWMLVAPPLAAAMYFTLRPLLASLVSKTAKEAA